MASVTKMSSRYTVTFRILAGFVRSSTEKWPVVMKCRSTTESQDRQFKLGDSVFVRNFTAGLTWVAGSITAENGPRSFIVELRDGQVVKSHIDHVRSRTVAHSQDVSDEHDTDDIQWPSLLAPAEPVIKDGSSSAQVTTPQTSTRQCIPPKCYTP